MDKLSAERIRLKFMQRMQFNLSNAFYACLIAVVSIAMLQSNVDGQDVRRHEGWLHAWQNQPSGEFAPDYRRVDPLKPMLSDADIDAFEARKTPTFLDRFSLNVKSPADAELDSPLNSDGGARQDSSERGQVHESASVREYVDATTHYEPMDEFLPSVESHSPQTVFSNDQTPCQTCWGWQVLPKGLMYKSYIAGEKEPRMEFVQLHDTRTNRRVWDAVLGGRVGLLRNGSCDAVNPQGFQLDLEGAVFARVLPDQPSAMLEGSDFRAGLLGTNRIDGTAVKYGYYHVSSHIGDEFLIANPTFNRINYVRDSLIVGVTQDIGYSTQVYGEIAYALGTQGGAEPWEFQFGSQYLPVAKSSLRGAPYLAANYHTREEFGSRGGFNTVAGWGWQGPETRHRIRVGFQYYNGPSLQYQFFNRIENMYGGGIWYDY